jgi:prepilin-type N-terminal cleavage/methylation domain-containing protein
MIVRTILESDSAGEAGFTLIEVLVAIGILTGVLLGLAMGASSVIKANKTSYGNTLGTSLAQDKLEELKSRTSSALPICPAFTTSGCSDSVTQAGVTFTRNWQILTNTPATGINQIDVRVTWTDYGDKTVTLSSNISQ